jgi:hypothetical protein
MTTTWGLDLSTNPSSTAAVALEWTPRNAVVVDVRQPLDAAAIVDLIAENEDPWAVDVPFGWAEPFAEMITHHHQGPLPNTLMPAPDEWAVWRKQHIALRQTDLFIRDHPATRVRPLPAAFQLLGATAAMWALIESQLAGRGVFIDRSGSSGRICETYPRAALAAWGHRGIGKASLDALQDRFPWVSMAPSLRASFDNDHARDALVCALVARARQIGATLLPDPAQAAAAEREGWIHVSTIDPRRLLPA